MAFYFQNKRFCCISVNFSTNVAFFKLICISYNYCSIKKLVFFNDIPLFKYIPSTSVILIPVLRAFIFCHLLTIKIVLTH